jgi:AcrR family transcriptional regulator
MSATNGNRSQQILSKSTELFAKHGFAGTSVRQIARACGITEAAIYRHFDGKLHLYEEVIRAKAAQHDIAGYLANQVGKGSVRDALMAVSSHVMKLTQEDPDLVRLMFHNSLEGGDVPAVLFQEIRMPYIDFLTREFERRMREGEIAAVEPFLTGRCFVGMVLDCALNLGTWNTLFPSRNQPVEIYTNTATIFANGLRKTGGAATRVAAPETGRTS